MTHVRRVLVGLFGMYLLVGLGPTVAWLLGAGDNSGLAIVAVPVAGMAVGACYFAGLAYDQWRKERKRSRGGR